MDIDQRILIDLVGRYISDGRILALVALVALVTEVVGSFCFDTSLAYPSRSGELSKDENPKKGLPLGNLTSQLLVNVYMNEFDQFVKHRLKVRYYVRYADDFVVLSPDTQSLDRIGRYIALFLREHLKLELHPGKVFIKTFASGVDFLGWIHFLDHRVLRSVTKRRMFRRWSEAHKEGVVDSYLGLLSHGNARQLKRQINVDRRPKP